MARIMVTIEGEQGVDGILDALDDEIYWGADNRITDWELIEVFERE